MEKEERDNLMLLSIKSSLTMIEAARKSGVSYSVLKRFAIKNNIFKPNQQKKGVRFVKIEDLLVKNKAVNSSYLKQRLIEEKILEYRCVECNINKWNKKDIVLELDHVDGDRKNNLLNNLRLLCPNCHSQTSTFRNRNTENNILSLKDDFIIENFNKSNSFNEFCNFIGLKNRGRRMITLMNRLNILGLNVEDKIQKNNLISSKNYTKNFLKKKEFFCKNCEKKIRNNKNDLCRKCYNFRQRKIERPSLEQLLKDIEQTNYLTVGKKYNVSDNAIRKWIKQYGVNPPKK